jgi:hypothetical protein
MQISDCRCLGRGERESSVAAAAMAIAATVATVAAAAATLTCIGNFQFSWIKYA